MKTTTIFLVIGGLASISLADAGDTFSLDETVNLTLSPQATPKMIHAKPVFIERNTDEFYFTRMPILTPDSSGLPYRTFQPRGNSSVGTTLLDQKILTPDGPLPDAAH